ncbi:MAG TPA: M20 family metallo-hydrolase [Magnetospirillaceae bacterium]|nr:M20 family metallo-hydrolase [Magnetospirillaceae bacterium]
MSDISKVYARIEESVDGIVELQSLLTSIPAIAPESGGLGEMKKAEALAGWLARNGLTILERYDAPDDRVPGGLRPNIVATIPGKDDSNRLWIMSHLDVVPEGDRSMWETDPFTLVRKDGVVYGRGTEDNHQGLVGSVFAALALKECGAVPTHTVKLLFVADEEYGSKYGIQHILARHDLFRKDDLIVIPDGGCGDGSEIEIAEKNICWLKISTKGKQCHGSTPDEGANAFLAACDLALRVHALENKVFTARDPLFHPDRSTLSPTMKEANVPNVNTIPGDDVFCLDMRILPQYPIAVVLKEIERLMRVVEKEHGVTMGYTVLQRTESRATGADAPVVKALSAAVAGVYGVQAKAIGIGGGTVGAYLRNAGFDCVVWARLDETAHKPNENARLANIVGDAKVFASLMLR